MPDAPPDAGPAGRSDPGKIGPLPIWGWALVAAGILGFFWWSRSHSGSSAAPTVSGGDTSGGASSGMMDTTTLANLLAAMQQFSQQNSPGGSVSPSPPAPDPAAQIQGRIAAIPSVYATTHSTGGVSTAHVSTSHLPTLPQLPKLQIKGILQNPLGGPLTMNKPVVQVKSVAPTLKVGPISFGSDPSKGPWYPSFVP